jgi:hypothetical protein
MNTLTLDTLMYVFFIGICVYGHLCCDVHTVLEFQEYNTLEMDDNTNIFKN